jgi:hypothetical protein
MAGKESGSLAASPTATGKQLIALRRDALITPCVENIGFLFGAFCPQERAHYFTYSGFISN